MGISWLARRVGRFRRIMVAGSTTVLAGCGSPSEATPSAPGGTGTATGTAGGHAMRAVAAAYFIGQSDDPTRTTVVYAFDSPVACGDLGAPGWDAKIRDKTGALEMKLIGTTPAQYPVSGVPNAPAGQAAVNFTVSSTAATPQEEASQSGTVKLDTLEPGQRAAGTFDLIFSDGSLQGTFEAAWCATGHEP
jgi:hypothetical protein